MIAILRRAGLAAGVDRETVRPFLNSGFPWHDPDTVRESAGQPTNGARRSSRCCRARSSTPARSPTSVRASSPERCATHIWNRIRGQSTRGLTRLAADGGLRDNESLAAEAWALGG